jgi:hypothetical protein
MGQVALQDVGQTYAREEPVHNREASDLLVCETEAFVGSIAWLLDIVVAIGQLRR